MPTSPKVVVVDDERASAAVVAKLFGSLGCQVTPCTRPERAVELALTGAFDVVSLDLSMPKLDGFQVLTLIRSHEHTRRLPSVPVVTVTGRVSHEDRAVALAAGFAAHLCKPLALGELRVALARCLVLRDELHRTRYTVDREAVRAYVLDTLAASPDGDFATTAGLALTVVRQGHRAIERSLLLALQGRQQAAREQVLELVRAARALGAERLGRDLLDLCAHLAGGGELLDTAAVLARAELDRVVFTVLEQIPR